MRFAAYRSPDRLLRNKVDPPEGTLAQASFDQVFPQDH